MTYVFIRVPEEIALAYPDETRENAHITLAWLGRREFTSAERARIVTELAEVASRIEPFSVRVDGTQGTGSFPAGDYGYPIWLPVSTDPAHLLSAIHETILNRLETAGIDLPEDTGDFVPHSTWRYASDPPKNRPVGCAGSWTCHHIEVYFDPAGPAKKIPLAKTTGNHVAVPGRRRQSNDPAFPSRLQESSPSPTGPRGTEGPGMKVPGAADFTPEGREWVERTALRVIEDVYDMWRKYGKDRGKPEPVLTVAALRDELEQYSMHADFKFATRKGRDTAIRQALDKLTRQGKLKTSIAPGARGGGEAKAWEPVTASVRKKR